MGKVVEKLPSYELFTIKPIWTVFRSKVALFTDRPATNFLSGDWSHSEGTKMKETGET